MSRAKATFIFPTFQTKRDSRDRCFGPAREEEGSRSFTQTAPNELKLGEGG